MATNSRAPNLRILHFQGDRGRYLALSTGQLPKILRPEFVFDLRSAISKAKKRWTKIATGPIRFEYGGEARTARLEVSPLGIDHTRKPEFLGQHGRARESHRWHLVDRVEAGRWPRISVRLSLP